MVRSVRVVIKALLGGRPKLNHRAGWQAEMLGSFPVQLF